MTDTASPESETVDLGTVERGRHRGGVRVGARIQTEGGVVLHQGAAAKIDNVLDALKDTGLLDGAEGSRADRAAVARSRYEQGAWLRQLFLRAGLNTVHAMDLNAKRGSGEMDDGVARARMRYNKVVRELGPFGEATVGFVCFDHVRRGDAQLNLLRKGLDRLCVMRG
ncbi:MAG: hypothetical protein SFV19_06525 [Rhodospirillaceae bacterium]|nr:hypothetical protein [Rhodospirillaceae bacterium]